LHNESLRNEKSAHDERLHNESVVLIMSKLVCRVELDKDKGIILTVENKDGKITQTAVMNGESITITSKGEQDTSTITQKPDSIAIKCKTFTLETETITCKSTKDTLHQSEQKMTIQSTGDMTLKSSAKLTEEATSDVKISGSSKVTIAATSNAELSGSNTTVSATSGKAEVKGLNLALSGTVEAKMDGASVKVAAKGMLNVESQGIATVKGAMTNIQGNLIKLG